VAFSPAAPTSATRVARCARCCRLCSYPGPGMYRERYPGVKIPPAGIQDYHLQTARKLAGELASRVAGAGVPH